MLFDFPDASFFFAVANFFPKSYPKAEPVILLLATMNTPSKKSQKKPLFRQHSDLFGHKSPQPAPKNDGITFRLFSLYDMSKYKTTTVSSSSF